MGFRINHVRYKDVSFRPGVPEKFKGCVSISLGGNALDNTRMKDLPLAEQVKIARASVAGILDYYEKGNLVMIEHGNGPQVGMLQKLTDCSLVDCSRMSQFVIGSMIKDGLLYNAKMLGIKDLKVKVIPTEVVVDVSDNEFEYPSKFIGRFMEEKDKDLLEKENPDWIFKYVEGNGHRRVVPSPLPLKILQLEEIAYWVSQGYIVISGGGGGVPVINTGNDNYKQISYEGVDAVIDKDYLSARFVLSLLEAGFPKEILKKFIIATEEKKVALNYKKPNVKYLDELSVSDAQKYILEKQFPDGSMNPKVKASSAVRVKGIPSYIVGLDGIKDLSSGTQITGKLADEIQGDILKFWVNFGRKNAAVIRQ